MLEEAGKEGNSFFVRTVWEKSELGAFGETRPSVPYSSRENAASNHSIVPASEGL